MSFAKEFFSKRVFINSLVFALPLSLLLLWRFVYVTDAVFFCRESGEVYLFFVGINICLYFFFQLLLLWLSRRRQRDGPEHE